MRRSWVVLPAVLLAGLTGQLGGAAPRGVDELALAAATSAARWHCALARRDRSHPVPAPGPGSAGVAFTEPAGARSDQPQPIPGLGTGPGENPRAEVSGTLAGATDMDTYAVALRAGEVLGVTVRGAGGVLEVRDPAGALMQGSGVDRSVTYPSTSPLPGGGNATVDHVAAAAGTYTVTVRRRSVIGTGGDQYLASVGVFRAGAGVGPQQIFLEYGGARLDITRFGVAVDNAQPAELSPLRSFLANWGLRPSDEPRLIQRITATVRENLSDQGILAEVSDSSQGAGIFGRPEVSRVVIGGTVEQAGIDTVGIAESVDPGNFVREENALVLLDQLSGPADKPVSLNRYLRGGGDRVEFIGRALGNIASHEAGHFLGSWHTDPASGKQELMAPGDVAGAFGFGADGLGGTGDDTAPRFGQDVYAPDEGFTGTEDTRARTTVGLDGGSDPGAG